MLGLERAAWLAARVPAEAVGQPACSAQAPQSSAANLGLELGVIRTPSHHPFQVYVRPSAAGRRTVGGSAAADAAGGELGMGDGSSGDGDDLGFGASAGAGPMGGQRGVYKFYFNIGSVDAFEHAMEEAQEALGVSAARCGGVGVQSAGVAGLPCCAAVAVPLRLGISGPVSAAQQGWRSKCAPQGACSVMSMQAG